MRIFRAAEVTAAVYHVPTTIETEVRDRLPEAEERILHLASCALALGVIADGAGRSLHGSPWEDLTEMIDTERGNGTRHPIEPLHEVGRDLLDLRLLLFHLLAAKVDRIKLRVTRLAFFWGLGAAGFLVLAALLVLGLAHLLSGLAGVLGVAFGGRPWLGDLLAGGGSILLILAGIAAAWRLGKRRHLQATVEKYLRRRKERREALGSHVPE